MNHHARTHTHTTQRLREAGRKSHKINTESSSGVSSQCKMWAKREREAQKMNKKRTKSRMCDISRLFQKPKS